MRRQKLKFREKGGRVGALANLPCIPSGLKTPTLCTTLWPISKGGCIWRKTAISLAIPHRPVYNTTET